MTEHIEPQRLLDDPGVTEALRSDLAAANAAAPVTYQVEAGLARFKASVATGGAEAATAAAATGGLSIFGGKTGIVAGVAGLLLAGGVTVFLLGGDNDEAPVDRAAVATVVDVADPQPQPVQPEAAPQPAAAAPEEETPEPGPAQAEDTEPVLNSAVVLTVPEKEPAPRPVHRKRAASDDSSSVLEEAKKVQQARKTLEADPNKTLRLLKAIDREFPKGQLMEERAGLRVLALLRAGKVDEGKRRADKYLARYPKGTLANRVRRALSELP